MKLNLREVCPFAGPRRQCNAGAIGVLFFALNGLASAQDNSAADLRRFIGQQVGGIEKLQVPAANADLPVPRLANGTVPYRYRTTEAKRFLGKLLFFDPILSGNNERACDPPT